MTVVNGLDIDEQESGSLLEEADALVAEGRADIPTGFVSQLFGRAAAEDLDRYTAGELAQLAMDAWDLLAKRTPDAPKIRCALRPRASRDPRRLPITVLEVVNDDMPFLVDSILGELTEQKAEIRLVAHPVFSVERDEEGRLVAFDGLASPSARTPRESFIHIHLANVEDADHRANITRAVDEVLGQVRLAVDDWRPMLKRVIDLVGDMRIRPPMIPVPELAEALHFMEWLTKDNFTFLGLREYTLTADGTDYEPNYESALGILRDRDVHVLRRGKQLVSMTPEIMAFLKEPKALIIAKANVRSRIHRRVYMDYIGFKRFDNGGRLVGETRVVGLFTSTAYTRSTRSIPYVRRKVDAVFHRAGFDPEGHSGKALLATLETFPRDELFQVDEDTLFEFALAILQLDERPRARVLARRDRFDRFVSVLVFTPRDTYEGNVRQRIGEYLARSYNGRVSAYYPFFTDGPLVRIHFIIGRNEGSAPAPDPRAIEEAIEKMVRSWRDGLSEVLRVNFETAQARALFERYRNAFSAGYKDIYPPDTAVNDIRVLESLSPERPLGVNFYRRDDGGEGCAGLKVWSYGRPIALSERVPVLENMGFRVVDERTFQITPKDEENGGFWFHDMMLERAAPGTLNAEGLKQRLESLFLVVMGGGAENDGYNALVLAAGLAWRDAALIRALSRYLRQIRVAYSQSYMAATLRKHGAIVARIAQLFRERFDPRPDFSPAERAAEQIAVLAGIETALQEVQSLDEDRILRHFVNVVQSALRTNFYQLDTDGQPKAVLAIKFDSQKIEGMPLPRPLYEIFVYSPRVEGVHLRFGKVARGGIRWSDRPQDFRTEILGLVKAQQVKNAVIVPVGAKGGFVPKAIPAGATRDVVTAEGIAAYKLFVSTLLDVTDNLGPDAVIPPPNVVRHDDDDPYLVVAADKGTATFSDIANSISSERGFWLGDAFASGGSAGYDHKKMGITARGAWESVKRHFYEMDVDITKTPFTVAGVGDMSGDVFGNGMLRERTIKLVAAFDHRDIFIDPSPDPDKSFEERQRLFDLPRSSWQDYNKSLISEGGGVFSRDAKEIALSPQIRELLDLQVKHATPAEIMRAILHARVDLLWFGGIGTYVRASSETDEAVGDRANDVVRITAAELRCKVIGEGANLAMTQRGRVEAGVHGVRLNTDAIDNSAGVNTSDLEVNIKIAFSAPVNEGRLTIEARNELLTEMTDEVAALVLRNNYQQPLALSLAQRRGLEDLAFQQRLMQTLEVRGQLERAVEFLPDEMEIAERRKRAQSLTRPELAVLLAYAKLSLKNELLESDVPDDSYLGRELGRYFPQALAFRFPEALVNHRLRREIITTQLANSMINRGGPSLTVRIADETGANSAAIAGAFAAVRGSYDMIELHTEIAQLDGKISGARQLELYAAVQDVLLDRMVWFLRHADLSQGLENLIEHYHDGISTIEASLDAVLPAEAQTLRRQHAAALAEAGVPDATALRLANLPVLVVAPDIVLISDRTGKPADQVAATYFAVRAFFQLDRIIAAAREIAVADYFDRLALDRAFDTIGDATRRLTAAMVSGDKAGPQAVDAWVASRKVKVERIRASIHEIAASGLTLSKLSVAANMLGDLAAEANLSSPRVRAEAKKINAGSAARR